MREVLRALIEANNEDEERDQLLKECGRSDEFVQQAKELTERYPEWMQLVTELLNELMPPRRVHPIISLFGVLPESLARNCAERLEIAHRITMRQIYDCIAKRFDAKPKKAKKQKAAEVRSENE